MYSCLSQYSLMSAAIHCRQRPMEQLLTQLMGAGWPRHTCRLLVAEAKRGHKCLGVGEVWVRVPAPKVLLWIAIQQRALWGPQLLHTICAIGGDFYWTSIRQGADAPR